MTGSEATRDQPLTQAFACLEPSDVAETRMVRHVRIHVDTHSPRLWRRWMDFFIARPVVHTAYALTALALMTSLSPLFGLANALPKVLEKRDATVAMVDAVNSWQALGALARSANATSFAYSIATRPFLVATQLLSSSRSPIRPILYPRRPDTK